MIKFPLPLQRLIRELSKLPSIGEKTAARLAYHLIENNKEDAYLLAEAVREAVEAVGHCPQCYFLSNGGALCEVCQNENRDQGLLCVVEKPVDVLAMERLGEFRGRYHVLHGLWSPLKGKGPEAMKLRELLQRVDSAEPIREVILALSATVEGDATSLYIARLIHERGIQVSRLAQGMPKGGELEYADEVTLSRAFSGRLKL